MEFILNNLEIILPVIIVILANILYARTNHPSTSEGMKKVIQVVLALVSVVTSKGLKGFKLPFTVEKANVVEKDETEEDPK